MKTLTKHIYIALFGISVLSSCSRPVAYFQPSARENYHAKQATVTPAATSAETPSEVVASTPVSAPASPSSEEQVAQAKQAVEQLDAYVRNDNKLASNKKLTKRMERVKSMLNSVTPQALAKANTNVTAKKMTLLERMATKKIDKKIKNKLSPNQPMAQSMLTIGLIVAAAGLLLLLIGNGFGAAIGAIALVVGLVLILLDILQ
ncbi:hypothetical protein GCM10028806_23740 [Spirosoma terrae]|uniref:Uncharacterized protein n=1 Tax=Spirosoma terrae TaxID=1968276 RepID=A0A6L9L1F4_9BACT|nr:hypothetical protein [Spirosoma terrae]NDU94316.1 hypothetical protein [Spirosoma terrae]